MSLLGISNTLTLSCVLSIFLTGGFVDYEDTARFLTFSPGVLIQCVNISTFSDNNTNKNSENFTATLYSMEPSNVVILNPNSTTITISK